MASTVNENPSLAKDEDDKDKDKDKEKKKKKKKKKSKKKEKSKKSEKESEKKTEKKSSTKKSKKEEVPSEEVKKTNEKIDLNDKNPIRKRKMGKKNYRLTEQDRQDELKQDLKEASKREGRLAKISPLQKESDFDHKPEDEELNLSLKPFNIGYEEEIYNGINYGKPMRLYDQIWLTVDLPVEPDMYCPQVQVPPGWRIPTLKDYQKLIEWCQDNDSAKILLTHKRLLNMNDSFQYITLDKVFPDICDGHNKKSWKYYCIAFDFEDKEEEQEKRENMDANEIKKKKKNDFDDTIVSEYKKTEEYDLKKKGIKKSELINPDDQEAEMIFGLNPYSVYATDTKENKDKKEKEKNKLIEGDNEEDLYQIFKRNIKNLKKIKLILNLFLM